MKSHCLAVVALVILAFGAGVYVQDRWPIGLWRQRWISRFAPNLGAAALARRQCALFDAALGAKTRS